MVYGRAEGVQQRGGLEADDGLDRGFHDLRAVGQDAEPATPGLAYQDVARHYRRALDVVWTSPGLSGRGVWCRC